MTVDEIYDQWRFEKLTPEDLAKNVAAIQASIDDMNNGERGRPAGYVIVELEKEFRLPASK